MAIEVDLGAVGGENSVIRGHGRERIRAVGVVDKAGGQGKVQEPDAVLDAFPEGLPGQGFAVEGAADLGKGLITAARGVFEARDEGLELSGDLRKV